MYFTGKQTNKTPDVDRELIPTILTPVLIPDLTFHQAKCPKYKA